MSDNQAEQPDSQGGHTSNHGSTDNHEQLDNKSSKHPNNPRVVGNSSQDLERQPLLSPDDPGVSPLNVSNVKISKFILNGFAFLSTIWFILLLLSDFVSIPGLNNKGRSFLEINFIMISIYAALTTLLFFKIPSQFERLLGYITGGIIGFIILLLLIFQREEMGLIGSLSVIWAFVTIIFTSFSEYLVEQGKIHEEIRLTGRVETRKTLSEWVIIFLRNIFKVFLLVYVVFISLNVLLHIFDVLRVKPWGEKVYVEDDGFRLHLSCYGDVSSNGSSSQPILLLESGHNSNEDFSEWVEELHHLNKVDRYCIYDRPGYGFSDSSPSPVSISIVSELLAEALRSKKINGPFLLIGYDIGGLYSTVFASHNTAQVQSMLLVDSWHEDLLLKDPNSRAKKDEKSLPPGIDSMSSGAGFKLWIRGLFSPLGLSAQSSWIFKHRGSKDRIYGRNMYTQGKYLRARLQEQISASILSYNEVISAKSSLVDIPISVVSSDFVIKKSLNWGNWQRELTKISSATKEWKIADGGHEIWKSPKGRDDLQDVLLRMLE
ncbi:hypothetical protein WICANDRAFT_49178 [Wickerhamomyces anomalus NRRL Y-366-8]|uniref:AB hydrolase-1 domain-containing protein n=1 Tax=Wickerhamomyces anomalus (strain ATCC 58044 / CBS 1984 / NCYC 433 / NRRL Y-366-8) TaxID=683960 RepID=A0A1E3PAN8_WICAA|nr:uncharacterized protein WICANDRAFT_49178 [Wickerhamomyces anomalus NRRL Y-366-8]ODQ62002.1 hypothetical protein WICANDRAFT_49178 [Wickerhamomyces anomalus NRRL Y-366-8]